MEGRDITGLTPLEPPKPEELEQRVTNLEKELKGMKEAETFSGIGTIVLFIIAIGLGIFSISK
ncbi:MAG: hypothetical protein LLG37_11310 [Spirochaetia bacterium]|nr:hypothetical protein [Spirochaetia bacterium]